MSSLDGPPTPRPPATGPSPHYGREPAWSNAVEVTEPVADRHLSGGHWWDPDRIAHRRDTPTYCPACASPLDRSGSLAVEYWAADVRTFHVRCGACSWSGDITKVERMIGHEAPHD